MKKISICVLAMVLVFSLIQTSCYAYYVAIELYVGKPELFVNGEKYAIDGLGTTPIIKDGRTFVPIRSIIEAMGGIVEWNGKSQLVTLKMDATVIKMTINKKTVSVNDEINVVDVAPIVINGRTMVPIRFVSENLGCIVYWNEKSQAVSIFRSTIESNNKIIGVWEWDSNDIDIDNQIWVLRDDARMEIYYCGNETVDWKVINPAYSYDQLTCVLTIVGEYGDNEIDIDDINLSWKDNDHFSINDSSQLNYYCNAKRISIDDIPSNAIRLDVRK